MFDEIKCPYCGSDDWWGEEEDDCLGGITKICRCADCDERFYVIFEIKAIEKL